MSLEEEQSKILEEFSKFDKEIEELKKNKNKLFEWNKYKGDVCCRIVKGYLEKHLPSEVDIVGPNVFIEGIPTEFDLMIVEKGQKPKEFTSAYDGKHVKFIIEVKAYPDIGKKEEVVVKYRKFFDEITDKYPSIKCVLFGFRGTGQPKRKGAKNWVEEIRIGIEPQHRFFVLGDSRDKEKVYPGQWESFITLIQKG